MKKILLLATYNVLSIYWLTAQTSDWAWGRCTEGAAGQYAESVAVDKAGNVYAAGTFLGTSVTLGDTTLTSPGSGNAYLVKYSPSGVIGWVQKAFISVGSSIYSTAIAVDGQSNVYISGFYIGNSLSFDSVNFIATNPTPYFFIAKYDSAGHFIWVKLVVAVDWPPLVEGMACDKNDNIYLTGAFLGDSITFGASTLYSSNPGTEYQNFFLVKYSPAGNVLWAVQAVGDNASNTYGSCCAVDSGNNICVVGNYTHAFVNLNGASFQCADTGYSQKIFIAKYNSAGNLLWAQCTGGNYSNQGDAIATDRDNNLYVTGYFYTDSIAFGPYALYNPNAGQIDPYAYIYADFFLVKMDSSGNPLWLKGEVTQGADVVGAAVTTDADGRVFVAGTFTYDSIVHESIQFDSITLFDPTTSGLGYPLFVAQFNSDGKMECGSVLEAGGSGGAISICTDNLGNAYLGGGYSFVPLIVGPDSLPYTLVDSIAGNTLTGNAFVARFRCGPKQVAGEQAITGNINLQICPNPSTGQFTIQLPNTQSSYPAEVYNMLGQKIEQLTLSAYNNTLNLTNQPTGMYFIYLQTQTGRVGAKVIVER